MPSTGNGPQWTDPLYCSDEHIAVHIQGEFAALCPQWATLAQGDDGSFAADAPWVLTSASVPFQQQGCAAQNVVVLSGPKARFPGGSHLFAVDSAAGNAVTLRRVGMPLNVGQPPYPAGIPSAVSFLVPSLSPQIDEATYRIKDRLSIDENLFWRGSSWLYRGAEDAFRVFRDAVVFETLADLYESQARGQENSGDWWAKARKFRQRADDAIDRIYARWGPTGVAGQPINALGTRVAR